MTDVSPFAAWLRQRRRALDLTRAELAQRAHCSASTIRRLEAGDLRSSKPLAQVLAAALNISEEQREAFVAFARGERTLFEDSATPKEATPAYTFRPPPMTGNLPAPLTSFVGRKRELRDLCELLRQPGVRLLNLTGSPGTGKTRLAVAVAQRLLGDFPDGAHFVPLAPITDPALVASAIAHTLEVREQALGTLSDALKQYLRDKRLLLVLDNFEQVIDAGTLVAELLATSPSVKALVTSREVLHIYGEHEYPVAALDFPDIHHLPSTQARTFYTRFAAMQLFKERARAVKPDFRLTSDNAADVARICAWLDGLPLAIEMAAAQAKWLPAHQLYQQLSDRLALLTGGPRDLAPRQQSLAGALDWSYERLDGAEQKLFEVLSVFVRGCTAEALSDFSGSLWSTTGGDATQDSKLRSLVEKSLLRAEPGASGAPRYLMLESIRAYARAKLSARGHDEPARQIHAEHYFQLAQTAKPHLLGGGELLWMNRLEEEHDNLRAALGWATEIPAREEFALALVDALYHFWHVRGYLSESRAWMERTLALGAKPTAVRARLLNYAGRIAQMQGDLKTAERYQQEALEMQSYLGDEAGTCRSLETLAIIAGSQGDYAHAGQLMEQALAVRRKLGDKTAMLPPLNNLAIVHRRQHNLTRAEELYRECAALCRELDAQKALSHALHGLAEVRYDLGDYTESFTLLRESVAIRHRLGNRTELANSFGALGMTRYRLGDLTGAAQLMSASLKLTEDLGMAIAPANRAEIEGNIALVRSALGDAQFEQAWVSGRALSVDAVVQFALSEPAIP